MRPQVWLLAAAMLSAASAQKVTVDAASDEGKLLERIEQQKDPWARQADLEEYVAKYPGHSGMSWVCAQLQPLYLQQQQFDKVLDVGTKALGSDPDNPDIAHKNLKAAEGKKDPELVKLWAARTSASARKIVAADKKDTQADKDLVDYARQLDVYTEYAVYALALQMTDAAKAIDLTETLEKRNPESQYLPKLYGKYLNALRQSGQEEKAGTRAEQLATSENASEDVLLIAADYNLQKKTQPDKVIQYAARLVQLAKAKPESNPTYLGLAYWMSGVTYSSLGKFVEADRDLRAGMPMLQDPQLRGIGLFHLGLADYQLSKSRKDKAQLQDALKWSEESAAIKTPVQAQAQKNAKAIRADLGLPAGK